MTPKKLSQSVTINLSPEDKARLDAIADAEERPAGAVARRLVLPALLAAFAARFPSAAPPRIPPPKTSSGRKGTSAGRGRGARGDGGPGRPDVPRAPRKG